MKKKKKKKSLDSDGIQQIHKTSAVRASLDRPM